MSEFKTSEDFLLYLRNEEGLEAYYEDLRCCRTIVAFDGERKHYWHEPDCPWLGRRRDDEDAS